MHWQWYKCKQKAQTCIGVFAGLLHLGFLLPFLEGRQSVSTLKIRVCPFLNNTKNVDLS